MRRTSTSLADGREIVYYDLDSTQRDRHVKDRRDLGATTTASEVRYDALLDEWVAVASHRQDRTHLPPADECPLCPSRDGRSTEVPADDYDVVVFENRGEEIGVTLGHPHGQVYAYPFVTPLTRRMLGSARRHRERTWRNLFADVLAAEVTDGSRVVHETEHWVAFVPAAARWPVEVHLYPRRQVPDLPALTDAERDDLAGAYRSLLRTLDGLYDAPLPYIAAWHQAPARVDRELAHLHLELFSVKRAAHKLKYLAGSESGMGAWINDVTPEHIADRLRAAAGATGRTSATGGTR